MNVNPNSMTPKPVPEDQLLDQALRPKTFNEYIGQNSIKENLKVVIGAAKKRKEPIEHLLLHGPSGLGKTTLAYLIAKELGTSIKITSGTALEKAGDVGSILTGLNDGDILFIDDNLTLQKIVQAVPCVEEPCEIYSSGSAVKYVLEINGNLAKRRSIEEGSKVFIDVND